MSICDRCQNIQAIYSTDEFIFCEPCWAEYQSLKLLITEHTKESEKPTDHTKETNL